MHTHCLNCGKTLTDAYCAGCGQKADTHRITLRNFIFHDLLHGTFHIERGMLFTARAAFVRPGQAALDYIAGKRKPYYNVFLQVLFTIGLIVFLRHFYESLLHTQGAVEPVERPQLNEASKTINAIFAEKGKLVIFLFVPLTALNGMLLFRRKRLNLSEHAIISGMILLGMLQLSLLGNVLFYGNLIWPFSDTVGGAISWGTTILTVLFVGFGYANAFAENYTKLGLAYRLVLFYLFFCLELLLLFYLLVGFVTDWKMGEVTLSPFG